MSQTKIKAKPKIDGRKLYLEVLKNICMKLAKKIGGPGALGTVGQVKLDQLVTQFGDKIGKMTYNLFTIKDFIGFCASLIGYQVGLARSHGEEIPEEFYDIAGEVFREGVRLTGESTYQGMKKPENLVTH
jgi:hypothetical protein